MLHSTHGKRSFNHKAGFLLSHCFWLVSRLQQSLTGFPYGCADAAATDGRLGSNVYEVNQWLWQFGRGKPRLGGLTIEETSERKDAVSNTRHKGRSRLWAETVRHRKATPSWFDFFLGPAPAQCRPNTIVYHCLKSKRALLFCLARKGRWFEVHGVIW